MTTVPWDEYTYGNITPPPLISNDANDSPQDSAVPWEERPYGNITPSPVLWNDAIIRPQNSVVPRGERPYGNITPTPILWEEAFNGPRMSEASWKDRSYRNCRPSPGRMVYATIRNPHRLNRLNQYPYFLNSAEDSVPEFPIFPRLQPFYDGNFNPQDSVSVRGEYTERDGSPQKYCPVCLNHLSICDDCYTPLNECACTGDAWAKRCDPCRINSKFRIPIPVRLQGRESRPISFIARKLPGIRLIKRLLKVLHNGDIDHWAMLLGHEGEPGAIKFELTKKTEGRLWWASSPAVNLEREGFYVGWGTTQSTRWTNEEISTFASYLLRLNSTYEVRGWNCQFFADHLRRVIADP